MQAPHADAHSDEHEKLVAMSAQFGPFLGGRPTLHRVCLVVNL